MTEKEGIKMISIPQAEFGRLTALEKQFDALAQAAKVTVNDVHTLTRWFLKANRKAKAADEMADALKKCRDVFSAMHKARTGLDGEMQWITDALDAYASANGGE